MPVTPLGSYHHIGCQILPTPVIPIIGGSAFVVRSIFQKSRVVEPSPSPNSPAWKALSSCSNAVERSKRTPPQKLSVINPVDQKVTSGWQRLLGAEVAGTGETGVLLKPVSRGSSKFPDRRVKLVPGVVASNPASNSMPLRPVPRSGVRLAGILLVSRVSLRFARALMPSSPIQ